MIAPLALVLLWQVAGAGDAAAGRRLYEQRCVFCHGETGRGDGPAAAPMWPRPRDFTRALYRIRSTGAGALPTDDDLFRTISDGLPGTPMPGWSHVLPEADRWHLVAYLKSLSPRYADEAREPLAIPATAGSAERGAIVYQQARCFLCHGHDGRGDGQLTAALHYEWGLPHRARDLTRGWTFKGGHAPADIYRRITGGLAGTPMGPYADLLTDQERWDLAHYVASLDQEPRDTSEAFLVAAHRVAGDLPADDAAPAWADATPMAVPLAGQVVRDPPHRWWTPTVGTATVRALWNGREIAFLLEWDDPTESRGARPDSAFLQFAADPATKPYLLHGDADAAVAEWEWAAAPAAGGAPAIEERRAGGGEATATLAPSFTAVARFTRGRWRVVFRRAIEGVPAFAPGAFVPLLVSIRDGDNAEQDERRATSTWAYATAEPAGSARPALLALCWALGVALVELALVCWRRP